MKNKHPIGTYIFVWLCNITAILIVVSSLQEFGQYNISTWIHFGVWLFILCIARLGGLFKFFGFDISVGWANAVEFAVVMILPFPLFCLAMVVSYSTIVLDRIRRKHPEPFLGPDFNAANVLIGGYIAVLVYELLAPLVGDSLSTLTLLLSGLTFAFIQILFMTILLSVDSQKHWQRVGTMESRTFLMEGVVIISGALVAKMYMVDPYLLLLLLLPLISLHRLLKNVNDSKLIYIDEKTGLYNYRYFDEQMKEKFQTAVQKKKTLSVVFGDMDNLREINNTYGHQYGDKAIVKVGDVFKQYNEEYIVARFGGEEFVMILPSITKAEAAKIAERIRIDLTAQEVPLEDGTPLKLSISLGVANYPIDATDMETLVKCADEALYEAKHSGKNTVKQYDANTNLFEQLASKGGTS
ncbi:GGDEF domain-containing protein [Salirhabdus salicampi]|uniref:GGDEF domain-containing protein n=1 Tax=Salirhabdus salicampi TaxID=476102 RepID=UPI0020C4BD7E|nr:GGDEF domain-containing protein [Salirhabdus salicampi]MCP8617330.1 GGDEF domain-containing protein [Salirhabdus salicampi]